MTTMTVVAVVGSVACIVVTMLVTAITLGVMVRTRRIKAEPKRMGAALGLREVVPYRGRNSTIWYAGDVDGAPAAITYVNLRVVVGTEGTLRTTLRITLPVRRPGAGPINLLRFVFAGSRWTGFEDCWARSSGGEQLAPREVEAVMAAVNDLNGLWLRDAASHQEQYYPPGVFDSEWVLMHDMIGTGQSADEVRARIARMRQLVQVLEGR